jgi:membrane protease YdiL (CAAX protease family)
LLGFLLQGLSEELLCRGYFMVSLAARQRLIVAVVVSSLAFAALHLANASVLDVPLALPNLFLFGVFTGVYMLKRGSIWGVCAIHSLWNFAQGNIFGIKVSGSTQLPSLLQVSAPNDTWQSTLINGGNFGLEGGIAVTIVLGIAIAVTLLLPAAKPQGEQQPQG